MRRSRSGLILLALFLGGCAWVPRFRAEPTILPFPDPPRIVFFYCDSDKVCLTKADAVLLQQWADKLRAFRAARDRLLAE